MARRSAVSFAVPLALVAACVVAPCASAQQAGVVGVVIDTSTDGRAVRLAGAEVRLVRTDSVGAPLTPALAVPSVRVDSSGVFAFSRLAAGVYRVDVRLLGYEPYEGYFVLAGVQVLHPRITMTRFVPRLANVLTTANRSYRARLLERSGFRGRERVGFGHFIDSEQITRLQPGSVYSLLLPYLRGCTMMYMSGMRAAVPRDLKVSEVVGVEIYRRNGETPLEYQNPTVDCGSIVIWTAIPNEDPEQESPPGR